MNIHDTMHFLAQGAINIAEGTEKVSIPKGAALGAVEQLGKDRYNPNGYVATGAFIAQGSRVAEALNVICGLLPPGEAHLDIKGARIKEDHPRKGLAPQFWVMHPSNDAILATCKTRKDAEAVVACLNTLAAYFEAHR